MIAAQPEARYRIGVDIGGTFTDFVLLDAMSGRVRIHKCLTTPKDPSIGALVGLDELLRAAGLTLSQIGQLVHGTTLHGRQYIDSGTFAPILPREPLTYYHRTGPIGQVMLNLLPPSRERPRSIAVIGLGTGSIAAYGEAGDAMTFYEIDPLVPWLAEQSAANFLGGPAP